MTIGKINITKTLASVESSLKDDKTMSPQVRAMLELLVVIIQLLLGKLGLNSNNSSKPPSFDPNRPRGSKRKAPGEKRKPGGQKGHEGTTLEKVSDPDRIETIVLDRKTIPQGNYTFVGYESRQVIDIEISRLVTEYRAEILKDSSGDQFVAKFPAGVTRSVQYGLNLKAQSVYMSLYQLIPYDRIHDYFSDQCDISISTGSIFRFNKEAYEALYDFEKIARKRLQLSDLIHADETGINVNGKRIWLHSASNDLWTLFCPHEKRGLEAMTAMDILPHFCGTLCHDHWKPYFHFMCLHALCNAHHLRELEYAIEQDGQHWAKEMQELLLEIKKAVEDAGGQLDEKPANHYVNRYRAVLKKADEECPPPSPIDSKPSRGRIKRTKSRNLLERLRDFENETLRFMTDKRVPFTNNQGENDIRMTKVQQKISGCFRSMEGAQIFCRVRSYLSTCRKHGMQPTEALKMLFEGQLPEFITYP